MNPLIPFVVAIFTLLYPRDSVTKQARPTGMRWPMLLPEVQTTFPKTEAMKRRAIYVIDSTKHSRDSIREYNLNRNAMYGTLVCPAYQSKPLIIVDSFPYEGDLREIDPSTVASIVIINEKEVWANTRGKHPQRSDSIIVITTKKYKKQ